MLAASYLFYMAWDVRFVALLLAPSTTYYLCGLGIANKQESLERIDALALLPGVRLAHLRRIHISYGGRSSEGGLGVTTSQRAACLFISNLLAQLFLCIQSPCRPEQTSRDIAYEHRVFEGGI